MQEIGACMLPSPVQADVPMLYSDVGSLFVVAGPVMLYQTKIEQLVEKHVAEFMREMSVAKQLQECDFAPPMPYGYPTQIYHPPLARKARRVDRILSRPAGKMSNGVPWLLGMDLVDEYILGLYNPVAH